MLRYSCFILYWQFSEHIDSLTGRFWTNTCFQIPRLHFSNTLRSLETYYSYLPFGSVKKQNISMPCWYNCWANISELRSRSCLQAQDDAICLLWYLNLYVCSHCSLHIFTSINHSLLYDGNASVIELDFFFQIIKQVWALSLLAACSYNCTWDSTSLLALFLVWVSKWTPSVYWESWNKFFF